MLQQASTFQSFVTSVVASAYASLAVSLQRTLATLHVCAQLGRAYSNKLLRRLDTTRCLMPTLPDAQAHVWQPASILDKAAQLSPFRSQKCFRA